MKNSDRVFRGMSALFLSSSVALASATGIVNTWRSSIDFALGTSSTMTTSDDKFKPIYETTDALVAAHKDLGKRVSEEGSVLLKNAKAALPLKNKKVTLFGMGSQYPFLGGVIGSTVTGEDQVDLVTALTDTGFEVNPTMVDIYKTFGEIQTGEKKTWTGTAPIYGHRPAEFSTPYEPSEPAISSYTTGGKAKANYQESFKEYNDAAIVVISRPGAEGNDYYPGEEGIDTKKYETDSVLSLSKNEKEILQLAKDNFDKVIVLVNSGSVMEIEELKKDEKVDSILYIGFPGAYGMTGVADVLSGKANPSGHLADTYAVDNSVAPASQNFGRIELKDLSKITAPNSLMGNLSPTSPLGSFGGEPAMAANYYLVEAEGIYTGYKYYESRYYDSVLGQGNASSAKGASKGASAWKYENEVSYPFGYGLSYTTFEQTLNNVKVDSDAQTVTATVTVKNTGNVAGKDVAQFYYQAPYTDYDKQHKVEKSALEFLGMEKTKELKPGESETVTITADMKYMTSWDSTAKGGKGGLILDGGNYYFAIGENAHDAVNNILAAQGQKELGNAALATNQTIGSEGQVDETSFAKSKKTGNEIVNQLEDADINYYKKDYATYLSRSDWEGTFPKKYDDLTIDGDKVDEWVQKLTNEIYQFDADGEVKTEYLNGSKGNLKLSDLAGSVDAGDPRWNELVNQIPLDVLIAKIAKGGSVSDVINEIASPLVYQNDGPNGFSNILSSRGEYADDKNATYNMGTMANEVVLGNTFNKALVTEWGQLLGNDGLMSGNWFIWGVGANVHRTAYNGRNFEYYSEDDMLSNYMARATVDGAMEYGVLVGPKHFAFNDQETQRSGIATYMNEQKAREGDLRAFQGAFDEGNGLAVMASFSRIGATPVNGSVAVLTNILRGEWGYQGLISTDMNNNAGYFRPEMLINAGVSMIADFSTNETMKEVNETWPYFTTELIKQDEGFVAKARDNMKFQLFAYANSAAQNVQTISVTPWWETAFYGVMGASGVLALVFGGLYFRQNRKSRKEGV
ncbi:glycoside hydrolase family 3 C-terminal domain-containing protein [Streptococcus sp. ZJ93]|uniref:beta-glucosidase n=1 Tax=Streptococcus handemini TaxID=3161188 RepID=UPI0034D732FE